MKLIRFSGPSGQGKTTIITEVVAALKKRQLVVAVVKHSHHDIQLPENKDSTVFSTAGTDYSLVIGNNCATVNILDINKTPKQWLNQFFPNVDIVIIEGWRKYTFPTILVTKSPPPEDWIFPSKMIGYIGWCPNPTLHEFLNANDIVAYILSNASNYP